MNVEQTTTQKVPFEDSKAAFEGFSQSDMQQLAYSSADFLIAIDDDEVVQDVSANVADHDLAKQWVGKKWADTVTVDSRSKIEQLFVEDSQPSSTWRQVNHLHDGKHIPVNYKLIRSFGGKSYCAVGRDMRALSELQQRLLKTQQSMERDYLTLRQTETRYRLLFDNIAYPVLIARADDYRIQQANNACHALFNVAARSLDNKNLLGLIAEQDRSAFIAYTGAIAVNTEADPVSVHLTGHSSPAQLSASLFRQHGKQYWLIDIESQAEESTRSRADDYVLEVIERMPDAFVLTNEHNQILIANRAIAELVQVGSVKQLKGQSLNEFFGRPQVDLTLLRKQLKEHEHVRNFGSVVNDKNGGEEPVEIAGIMIDMDQPIFAYTVRAVARRERELQDDGQQLPRSVDQLTNLVGRKSLKEIVRESTDLIERMCIEAALVHTSDNRASAAEILGLSRQSLYSKLHRHGLGNLPGKD